METFQFCDGDKGNISIHICLMVNVCNMKTLRGLLINGSLNAALLKPSMVADIFPIIQAAHKAVFTETFGKLKTKSKYTELLYNLSPTSKISESLKLFGVGDNDKEVFIAHLSTGNENEMDKICDFVDGQQMPLSNIKTFTDEPSLVKLYKVTPEELSIGSLSDAIVNCIAVKDSL